MSVIQGFKNIFLGEEEVEQENIPHCCTDEIGKMPYSEFTNTLYYPTDIMETSSLRSYGYKENVEQWKMILAALD